MSMKNKGRESGFSVVESLVAVVLIAMVGLLLAYFSSNRLREVSTGLEKSCTQHATMALDKIRALGAMKALGVLDMQNNQITRPLVPQNQIRYINPRDELLVPNEILWSQNLAPRIVLQNHKALIGSISLLNALYESDPAFCANALGSTYDIQSPQKLTESGDFESLKNVNSTIRIQPYSLQTGDPLGCIHPLVVLPSGITAGPPNASVKGVTRLPTGARNDVGFKVTVFTNYDSMNGASNAECSASAQYSYPNVTVNPDTLEDIAVIVSRSSVKTAINNAVDFTACDSQVPLIRVTVQTGVQNYNTTRGLLMLCRARSTFALQAGSSCIGAPQVIDDFTSNSTSEFVPCHQMRVCGQQARNISTSQVPNGYVLDYEDVNIGCSVTVDAYLVDLGQNVAANATGGVLAPPNRNGCPSCGPGYVNRPPSMGFCPGGIRTPANSCDPDPTGGTTTGGDGGDGEDGANDGGNSDGKGNDGGDGP